AFARRRRHRSAQSCCLDSWSRPTCVRRLASPAPGGPAMISSGRAAKILLIDSNVYFAKKLGDALKREGFEVISSTQAAFALTTLEYDTPVAIVCATNMREMGALEIARILHADPKTPSLPVIPLGAGSQRPLRDASRPGCHDYTAPRRPPATIA